ncbi:MAG: hypothetical protein GY725_04030 [bacterium]|nr:hypothetical protein [bacterium]
MKRTRFVCWVSLLVLFALPSPAAEDPLAQRAQEFRRALLERHWSREGLVLYRVKLSQIARDLEVGSYPDLADTPTFNGILAASACAHSRHSSGAARAEALADAERALSGLELLARVSGRRGLLARAIRRSGPSSRRPERWHRGASGYESFWWRDDASMDQYANGLVLATALCRDEFPRRTRSLVVDAAEHLLANDMQVIDVDGEPTRFGDLSPRSGFGFNAQAQLTGYGLFALAAALDDDPRWSAQRDRLRDRFRVGARSRVTNLSVFGITNHSNDLMAFHLYRALIPLARTSEDPVLPELRHGLYRAWSRVREYENPYFTAIFCQLEPGVCSAELLESVRSQLASFPPDKRKQPARSGIESLPRRWLPGRKFERLARSPVPIGLRPATSFEWKSSPFRLHRAVAPDLEFTGLDFLVAYWLYLDLLAEAEAVVP